MKRCEFFIIYNADYDYGKTAFKVKGYMFQKCGHWFTVRRRIPSDKMYCKKWIISDFVTGLKMTDTDSSLKDIPSVISEAMAASLLELYRNSSGRVVLQHYAEMIHGATYKNNPNSKMPDLLKDQAYELFN